MKTEGAAPARMSAARCHSWADAITRFWREMQALGAIDAAAALDVVDLAPGCGEAIRPLLQALIARGTAALGMPLRLRYLACTDGEAAPAWAAQPELRALVEAGLVALLRWTPGADMPSLAGAAWQAANPVVFLSHDLLQRMPRRLLAVHYGRMFEADPRALDDPRASPTEKWRALDAAHDDAALAEIRHLYAGDINSAPVCVGERPARMIEQAHAIAPRGYLALHAAPGTASRRSLRLLGVDAAVGMRRRDGTLPVDFELLGLHACRMGAAVWSRELADGWVVHAAVGRVDQAPRLLGRCAPELEQGDAGDTRALAAAMNGAARHADSDAVLALLRSARFDVDVFAAACPMLHERLLMRPVRNAAAWSQALHAVWAQLLPHDRALPLHREVALSAMRIADWPLAKQAWRRGIEAHGECAHDLAQLGWCHLRTGNARQASIHVAQALALEPADPLALQADKQLQHRLSQRDAGWRRAIEHRCGGLVLEPLDVLHLDALAHQYRDPQIALMAGLPALPADGNARRWFESEFAREARTDYAVVHTELGFVGHVGLEVDAGCALFVFWTGIDFQGRGLGIEAGRALADFAATRGVSCIFASAYSDNSRSLRALQAIGFERLPVRSTLADSQRVHLARAPSGMTQPERLQAYIGLHGRLALPIDFEAEAGALSDALAHRELA